MTAKAEIKVHTKDLDEITAFIERNKASLRRAPKFYAHLADIMLKPNSYIFFKDDDGFHMEPGLPLLEVVAVMRRGGCK